MGARRALLASAFVAAALAGCGGGDDDKQKSDLAGRAGHDRVLHARLQGRRGDPEGQHVRRRGQAAHARLARRCPPGSVELVLVVEDPDAPDGTFTHWTAWGIAALHRRRPGARRASSRRASRKAQNSAGKDGWTPPCPPEGDDAHRYEFSLYALDKGLTLEPGASPEEVKAALKGALGRGTFTGTYKRDLSAATSRRASVYSRSW